MARMYSSRKGKSGSTRPQVTEAPSWSNSDKSSVEATILDLAKAGHSTAEIGTILRDQHAVPNVRLVTGKRLNQILSENGVAKKYPEDMMNLMKQAVRIINHLGTGRNHKDLHNKRALELTEGKIRRLANYYKKSGRLPEDWRYKRDELRLMVE
ncbi:MAG: 30S ribosomal protein S15 [archaeon]|nr:30S ribosomal protein S15 [archaeon]MDA0842452.1 30S ribosomal protein S15 [archaeon]MDA1168003.1 30S ribosomal protein S15 [archaeon]